MYSQEYGLLGPSGFIPAGYAEYSYGSMGIERADVLPISGKIVVTKATWTEWLAFDSAFTAKFSTSSPSTLDHVPVLVAQWAGGTSVPTPAPPSYISQIGFSRYTDLGESMYSQEYGLLGPSGFIPAGYAEYSYGSMGIERADVLPISGKIVVTKATWTEWLAFDSAFTAKFSTSSPSTLDHVPVLVAQWAGGTGVPTPVPPSYVSQIGFSRYTDLSESMYSQEYGLLGPSGFIPANYLKRAYSTIGGPSRAEILPISGKIVVTKATWTEWLAFDGAFTAKFSTSSPSTLNHVPVFVAQWAGGTALSCPDSVAVSLSGNTTVLKFASVSGSFYDVQYCTDLGAGNWVVLASNLPGTGAQLIVNDPSAGTATRRFYRVVVHL